MIYPSPERAKHIWQLPTYHLWEIVLGVVTVDSDDTVEKARANLRLRGELKDFE